MSRSKEYQRLLNSPRWAEVKRIVDQRAKGLCERCIEMGMAAGVKRGWLKPGVDHHHIVPVESGRTLEDMERLCYNPDNVRLLCVACHIAVHTEQRSHSKEAHKQREDDRLSQWISRQRKK